MKAIAGSNVEWSDTDSVLAKGASVAPEAPYIVHNATKKPATNALQNDFMHKTRALDAETRWGVSSSVEGAEEYSTKAFIRRL